MSRHPSHATVVAYLALFVALGGTSVAAVSLKRNSVGSKQLRNGGVKGKDLGKNSVTSIKVKNHSLKGLDFKAGQLPAGTRGARGVPGTRGAVGPTFATAIGGEGVPSSPPDSSQVGSYKSTFTTPARGRLLVFAQIKNTYDTCSAGANIMFLTVDGAAVSTTSKVQMSGSPLLTIGVSQPVAAGAHTLKVASDCPGGTDMSSHFTNGGDLGAALIGS